MRVTHKLRILVDMDGITADFNQALLAAYNKESGENITEFTSWDFADIKHPELVNEIFRRPGFFRNLVPIAGAIEGLRKLVSEGHEVVVVSSPVTPISASEKIEWVAEHLPFLPSKNLWLGHNKHHIKGDVLIDDGLHNAAAYRANWPYALIMTIAYPYNEDHAANYDRRYPGYGNPHAGKGTDWIWDRMVAAIEAYASIMARTETI
jgi:5'(3')-deoxyribonucleotidase